MTDRVNLDDLEALEAKATPGPWTYCEANDRECPCGLVRSALPALLAELRAARELEAALARLDDADRGVIERLSDGDWFCPTSASGPRAPTLRALLLALGAEQ